MYCLMLEKYDLKMAWGFQEEHCPHQNSWNIFLLTLLEKVSFPWWSSPHPYILSKVMQLRLLLHRKYSFYLPLFCILRTRSQAAVAPALCSAVPRPCSLLDISELLSARAAAFHTTWLNTFSTGWSGTLRGPAVLYPQTVCTTTAPVTFSVCDIYLEMRIPQENIALVMLSIKVN